MEWFRSLDMFLLSPSNNVYIDRTAEINMCWLVSSDMALAFPSALLQYQRPHSKTSSVVLISWGNTIPNRKKKKKT